MILNVSIFCSVAHDTTVTDESVKLSNHTKSTVVVIHPELPPPLRLQRLIISYKSGIISLIGGVVNWLSTKNKKVICLCMRFTHRILNGGKTIISNSYKSYRV